MSEYDVILADPPWSYTGQQDKWGAAAKFYPTMSRLEIGALNLPLANPGVLFLWATGPKLHDAIDVIQRWDLEYRGVAFVWVKTKKDGTPIGAQGVRPSIVKPLTEFVLVGSTNKTGRPLPLADESICQTVFAPKQEHSRKPDEIQDRIELMYPDATKLEMFARRRRDGWDAWGDEIPRGKESMGHGSCPLGTMRPCLTNWVGRYYDDPCDDCRHALIAHTRDDKVCSICSVLEEIREQAITR